MKNEHRTLNRITGSFTLDLIELALHNVHAQLNTGDNFKASPSDLIRLIEAHHTMQQAKRPSEVLVRWIDTLEDTPAR
jgi:hypothetical protein